MFAMSGVKVVFNAVVRTARKFFCDVRPFIAQSLMKVKYHSFLLLVYRILLNVWIEVIVPAKI